ncbi:Integrase [Flavobacterium jumunjinense]
MKAKNKIDKVKIIPEILIKRLPDLKDLDQNYFLFTPNKIGDTWDTKETNKRDYFSKRFNDVVKKPLGLGKDYGLYSFRHTYITKLYNELAKDSTPFEAKSKLMLITGHSTMTALDKYLRDIDAVLPDDYSELLDKI